MANKTEISGRGKMGKTKAKKLNNPHMGFGQLKNNGYKGSRCVCDHFLAHSPSFSPEHCKVLKWG